MNNKWIKSQKVVNFPFEDFDPTEFLASVPKETILRHRELTAMRRPSSLFVDVDETISESEDSGDEASEVKDESQPPKPKNKVRSTFFLSCGLYKHPCVRLFESPKASAKTHVSR